MYVAIMQTIRTVGPISLDRLCYIRVRGYETRS